MSYIIKELNGKGDLTVEGTAQVMTNDPYGLQTLRLELDDSYIPTKVIDTHQLKCISEGEYVDTQTSFNPSNTDVTVAIAFEKNDLNKTQLIFSSGGVTGTDDKIELSVSSTNDLKFVLGKSEFDITTLIDPVNPIHNVVARFDKETKALSISCDGGFGQDMGVVDFTDVTGMITYGGAGYEGYLSEYVASAAYENEIFIQTFWNNTKLAYLYRPTGEAFYNWDMRDGTEFWVPDTNYPAVILDNGNGSIHVAADSNPYDSIMPEIYEYPSNIYVLSIVVTNCTGEGRIAIKDAEGFWQEIATFNSDGAYYGIYNGEIKGINIGANNDTGFKTDIHKISLQEVLTVTVGNNGTVYGYDAEEQFGSLNKYFIYGSEVKHLHADGIDFVSIGVYGGKPDADTIRLIVAKPGFTDPYEAELTWNTSTYQYESNSASQISDRIKISDNDDIDIHILSVV